MHIVDGALSLPVVITGLALTGVGVAIGLKKMPDEHIATTAVLSAVFFIASLIHVPAGPSSLHLILNGVLGLVLGWSVFPALLIALILQMVFFGFGGFLVIGVNTFNIALPALLVYFFMSPLLKLLLHTCPPDSFKFKWLSLSAGFMAGFSAIAMTAIMVAISLAFTGESFYTAAKLVLISHIPVMIIEGFITAACLMLILRVKPELLLFNRPLRN
jgi:cobalt/nickel transport system permease protein